MAPGVGSVARKHVSQLRPKFLAIRSRDFTAYSWGGILPPITPLIQSRTSRPTCSAPAS